MNKRHYLCEKYASGRSVSFSLRNFQLKGVNVICVATSEMMHFY